MNLVLSIENRLHLQGMFAGIKGDYVTLKLVREFTEDLSFSVEEIKEFNIRTTIEGSNSSVQWNHVNAKDKEFIINDVIEQMIIDSLKSLNKSKALEQKHFQLYEIFVASKEREKEKEEEINK